MNKLKSSIMIPLMLLFSIFCFRIINSKIHKDQVEIAINCGGPEYVNPDGIVYRKDSYFDNGISSDYGLNYDIQNTEEMEVYQTERWHSDTFTYSVPLKNNGKYILILKFSEVYFDSPLQKVFDIALGKRTFIKDLDIFSKVGKAAALDEFIEFELRDDKIYVNRSEVPGAYDAKAKTLKIRFLKGAKDNPKINAILVYKGDLNDTAFVDKKKKLEEANRKRLQELKRNVLIELRHHPDEVYDEDAVLNEDNKILMKDEPNIFEIFFTLQGAYIVVSLGVMLLINYLLDWFESTNRRTVRKPKIS